MNRSIPVPNCPQSSSSSREKTQLPSRTRLRFACWLLLRSLVSSTLLESYHTHDKLSSYIRPAVAGGGRGRWRLWNFLSLLLPVSFQFGTYIYVLEYDYLPVTNHAIRPSVSQSTEEAKKWPREWSEFGHCGSKQLLVPTAALPASPSPTPLYFVATPKQIRQHSR